MLYKKSFIKQNIIKKYYKKQYYKKLLIQIIKPLLSWWKETWLVVKDLHELDSE